MKNYKMVVSYDGTRYFGWEHQPDTEMTIQGKLEAVLNQMVQMPEGESVTVIGAGRTDAGVHARAMTCNVLLDTDLPEEDIQAYMIQFSAFSQDLMMLMGNLMKFKLRLPGFFKKAIYSMTEKTVNDIFNKNDFSDAGVMKTVVAIRQYDQKLGFSQQWVTDFVYRVVMLAKKEKRPADTDTK